MTSSMMSFSGVIPDQHGAWKSLSDSFKRHVLSLSRASRAFEKPYAPEAKKKSSDTHC